MVDEDSHLEEEDHMSDDDDYADDTFHSKSMFDQEYGSCTHCLIRPTMSRS